jgi:hypothetical protein
MSAVFVPVFWLVVASCYLLAPAAVVFDVVGLRGHNNPAGYVIGWVLSKLSGWPQWSDF